MEGGGGDFPGGPGVGTVLQMLRGGGRDKFNSWSGN